MQVRGAVLAEQAQREQAQPQPRVRTQANRDSTVERQGGEDAQQRQQRLAQSRSKRRTWDESTWNSSLLPDLVNDLSLESSPPSSAVPPARFPGHGRHTSMMGLELKSHGMSLFGLDEEKPSLREPSPLFGSSRGRGSSLVLERDNSFVNPEDTLPDLRVEDTPSHEKYVKRRSVTFGGNPGEITRTGEPEGSSDDNAENTTLSSAFARNAFASNVSRPKRQQHQRTVSEATGLFYSMASDEVQHKEGNEERLPVILASPSSNQSPQQEENTGDGEPRAWDLDVGKHSSHSNDSSGSLEPTSQHEFYRGSEQHPCDNPSGAWGVYPSPPSPPPPPMMPGYFASPEQFQAMQSMQNHMMMQWVHMQEQHHRLMLLEQQRAEAAGFPPSGSVMPPLSPPPMPMFGGMMGSPPASPPMVSPVSSPVPSHFNLQANSTKSQGNCRKQTPSRRGVSPQKGPRGRHENQSNRSTASSLLLNHKNTGYRPTIEELRDHVVEFACDNNGSRHLQYMNEGLTDEQRQILVDEAMSEGTRLMTDVFANYVMQNLLVHCNPRQRIEILSAMRGKVLQLSRDQYGTRVVQRALEVADLSWRYLLLNELSDIAFVACDPNATHVLQKALSLVEYKSSPSGPAPTRGLRTAKVSKEDADFLNRLEKAIEPKVIELSCNQHASRLVLLVLGDCDSNRSTALSKMLDVIGTSYDQFMWNQHGVFVVGHLLDNGTAAEKERIHGIVCENVLRLSVHKFGSHLVEKALKCATDEQVAAIVDQILDRDGANSRKLRIDAHEPGHDNSVILHLAKDPYANFVVSKAFSVSRGKLRDELYGEIEKRAPVLSSFCYGKHILNNVSQR